MIKSMIWIDFSLIGFVVIFFVLGLLRGFSKAVFSLSFWMLASWVGLTFCREFSGFLESIISHPSARMAASFMSLFVITLSLGGLIGLLLSVLTKDIRLTVMDRFAGMALGVVHGMVVVAVMVILAGLTSLPKDSWWTESTVIPPFQVLALWLRDHFPLGLAETISYR